MTIRHALFLLMLIATLTTSNALGHHGSIYDNARVVTIQGTLSRYEWTNPHVYLFIEEETENGEIIEWEVELFPPSVLIRTGWPRDTVAVGESLLVTGNPARQSDRHSLFPVSIQRSGTTLFATLDSISRLTSAGAQPATDALNLAGTWETLMPLELVMAFATPTLELTSKGADALAAYDDASMNPGADCIAHSAPLFMIDPDLKRIEITDDLIEITGSSAGDTREIHMNGATHEGASASNQGHSIGRWDGDTLIIDTTHFADNNVGNAYVGVPSGSRKHLVEQLSVNDERTGLTYSFELSDPEYLSETVTGTATWAYRPDIEFVQEECELDSARRFIQN